MKVYVDQGGEMVRAHDVILGGVRGGPVLGLDPSKSASAWCVLDPSLGPHEERRYPLLGIGEDDWTSPGPGSWDVVYSRFIAKVRFLIHEYDARLVAYERLIGGQSSRSGAAMHAHGGWEAAILIAAMECGIGWQGIPPTTVKKVATGNGHAKKSVVAAHMLNRHGYTGLSKMTEDKSDALAIAWTACEILRAGDLNR